MSVKYLSAIVECDNCGARYFITRKYAPNIPKTHRVCNTCFLPMETVNPFYDNTEEGRR